MQEDSKDEGSRENDSWRGKEEEENEGEWVLLIGVLSTFS